MHICVVFNYPDGFSETVTMEVGTLETSLKVALFMKESGCLEPSPLYEGPAYMEGKYLEIGTFCPKTVLKQMEEDFPEFYAHTLKQCENS